MPLISAWGGEGGLQTKKTVAQEKQVRVGEAGGWWGGWGRKV